MRYSLFQAGAAPGGGVDRGRRCARRRPRLHPAAPARVRLQAGLDRRDRVLRRSSQASRSSLSSWEPCQPGRRGRATASRMRAWTALFGRDRLRARLCRADDLRPRLRAAARRPGTSSTWRSSASGCPRAAHRRHASLVGRSQRSHAEPRLHRGRLRPLRPADAVAVGLSAGFDASGQTGACGPRRCVSATSSRCGARRRSSPRSTRTDSSSALPFMPEMLAHCGKRFRVSARAYKACDTIDVEAAPADGERRPSRGAAL